MTARDRRVTTTWIGITASRTGRLTASAWRRKREAKVMSAKRMAARMTRRTSRSRVQFERD
jgi:hypothetical protein